MTKFGNGYSKQPNEPSNQGNFNPAGDQPYQSGAHNTQAFPREEQFAAQAAEPQYESRLPSDGAAERQAAAHEKPKKVVGLGTAAALALVAALVGGTVAGVTASQLSAGSSNQAAQNAVTAPPAKKAAPKPKDGGSSYEQVASHVTPSVVSIRAIGQRGMEEGSGSIISSDGMVMTNNHVIATAAKGGGAKLEVTLNDGRTFAADVVAGDGSTDIAVIKMKDAKDLPTIQFGDSNDLSVGQEVVAVGSPLGLSSTVTAGIVSALQRPVRASGDPNSTDQSSLIDAIQTDAAINPGNSGGPLVDMNGNQIGMNSMIASPNQGSIGLGFAIPINQARRYAQQLIDHGKVTQPMLGVMVKNDPSVKGALLGPVEPGGAADKAGLKQGDVVVGVNDRLVDSADGLVAAIRSQDFGATVTLKVIRGHDTEPKEIQATLSGK